MRCSQTYLMPVTPLQEKVLQYPPKSILSKQTESTLQLQLKLIPVPKVLFRVFITLEGEDNSIYHLFWETLNSYQYSFLMYHIILGYLQRC